MQVVEGQLDEVAIKGFTSAGGCESVRATVKAADGLGASIKDQN